MARCRACRDSRFVRRALSLLLVAALTACSSAPTSPPAAREGPQELGERGPVAAPQRSPLVEPPGALLADVTEATIQTTICVSGWTATVRPSTSFTQHLKQLMLARAGLKPADAITYELDHFVPFALGGSQRSEDNLWLLRRDGQRVACQRGQSRNHERGIDVRPACDPKRSKASAIWPPERRPSTSVTQTHQRQRTDINRLPEWPTEFLASPRRNFSPRYPRRPAPCSGQQESTG